MCIAQAQMGGMPMGGATPAGPGAGSPVTPAAMLDAMLSDFEHSMMNVAKAMPADKYNFAPTPANFAPGSPAKYDGVLAFGPMLIHVAQGIYNSFAQASGMKPDVDPKTLTSLKSKDEIVNALQQSFAFAHKATTAITPENAFLSVRGTRTRLSIAATGIAHSDDHYGQLVEYLRMNGVIPPGSAGADPVQ